MSKEKNKNKLSLKEKTTIKILYPLIEKCIIACYETTKDYIPDIEITKEQYSEMVLKKMKGDNIS